MKRLRHWLFNFAAVVSLALFLLSVALWMWSDSKKYAPGFSRSVKTDPYATRISFFAIAGGGSYGVYWDWAPRTDHAQEYVE